MSQYPLLFVDSIWKTGKQNPFQWLILKSKLLEGFLAIMIISDWELADKCKIGAYIKTYVMSPIWFKRQHISAEKRKKNLDDLKCSPESDIES